MDPFNSLGGQTPCKTALLASFFQQETITFGKHLAKQTWLCTMFGNRQEPFGKPVLPRELQRKMVGKDVITYLALWPYLELPTLPFILEQATAPTIIPSVPACTPNSISTASASLLFFKACGVCGSPGCPSESLPADTSRATKEP